MSTYPDKMSACPNCGNDGQLRHIESRPGVVKYYRGYCPFCGFEVSDAGESMVRGKMIWRSECYRITALLSGANNARGACRNTINPPA